MPKRCAVLRGASCFMTRLWVSLTIIHAPFITTRRARRYIWSIYSLFMFSLEMRTYKYEVIFENYDLRVLRSDTASRVQKITT
jgi:hypothetical protein